MTVTRHAVSAVLPLPSATPVGTPVYNHDFSDDRFHGPSGWAPVAPATADSLLIPSYQDPSKLASFPAITYTAGGGGGTYAYTLTGLVAGRTYRILATVYNAGTGPVIPVVYAGAGTAGGVPPAPLPVGQWRYGVQGDFTTTGTTAVLVLATASLAGSRAGRLCLGRVTVWEVAASVVIDLEPESVTVTLDEGWTPYARAQLVCPMPVSDALTKIDPRLPQRVRVTLSRDGAASLAVSDLTAMLPVSAPARYNRAVSPRANTWTAAGAGVWTRQPLTGPGINPPNGADGGSRFVATTAASGSRFDAVSAGTNVPVGPAVASIYGRSSVDQSVRVTFTRGAASAFADTVLRAGRWQRVQVPVTVAVAGAGVVSLTLLAAGTAGQVIDVTQEQIEAGAVAGLYFDGSIGRPGTPPGFPLWTGAVGASESVTRYGASLASHFTAYFVGLTAAYLTDLFADTYGPTMDPTLTQSRDLDLGLRSRALDYLAGTMTLELASDEMLLQDYGRLNTTDSALVPPAGTSLKSLTSWALNLIGADLDPSSSDAVIASGDVVWSVGTSLWDFLDGFVRTAGLVLWCDERRRWYLSPPVTGVSGTDNVAALTQLDDVLDRDGWADAVVLANHWADPATGADTTTYAGQSVATTYAYTKLVLVDKINKGVATVAGAQALLDRIRTRGRRVRVSAVSDYSVTPGHTANLTTPTTLIDPCMVSAVVWELPTDEMTITTKDLP